ncbi:MAG: hypothetical protein Q9174_002921 [Haloplaca sp. 1 TL-2023]
MMTVILGKRKRRKEIAKAEPQPGFEDESHGEQAQNLLRKYFESTFEPLESSTPVVLTSSSVKDDHDTDDASPIEWSGLSEDEERSTIVVDYQKLPSTSLDVSREHLKSFMTSKPPLQPDKPPATAKKKGNEPIDAQEAATDAANLQKDLALQRLLQESHLLDPASTTAPSGQKRHKALDLRQQALGSKSSVFLQKNMPLAQRKGIVAKTVERADKRRRDAKENGIILEKAVAMKRKEPQRQRGIGGPNVGKFSNGMLTLSKKDVANIVGPKKRIKRR